MSYPAHLPCLCAPDQCHRILSVLNTVPAALQHLAGRLTAVEGWCHPVQHSTSNSRRSSSSNSRGEHRNQQIHLPQLFGVHGGVQLNSSCCAPQQLGLHLPYRDANSSPWPSQSVMQQQHVAQHYRHSNKLTPGSAVRHQQAAASPVPWQLCSSSSSPWQCTAPSLTSSSSRQWAKHQQYLSLQLQQQRGFVSSSAPASVPLQALLIEELQKAIQADESQSQLTPAAVVERLDKVIVGQQDAKKAVAIAFRNRWRRQRVVDPGMRGEITPKNLLLMGPTGCGKTEIARRLAKLAEAPFVKVEATKFTEVGYHGRDVDSIIRDLVEVAQTTVKQRCQRAAAKRIAEAIESHILHLLLGEGASHEAIAEARDRYRAGELEDARVEIEVPSSKAPGGDNGGFTLQSGSMSVNVVSMFGAGGGFSSRNKERRTMTVAEARPYLEEMETERQFPPELIMKEAIRVAEQEGIIFIDEIDKIVNPSGMLRHGSDPSAEGVQRDLLPLIEGSVVSTKHGPVATDHMLFIASGAFTSAKPSDMMAELQGRLPIRVELKGLTAADFEKILTEPECNMIYQQQQLLGCEGVDLVFTPAAIKEVAALAEQINKEVENIGARRLHTVLERLVEDISFEAPDKVAEAGTDATATPASSSSSSNEAAERVMVRVRYEHVIDKKDVQEKLADLLKKQDLDKYIL